MQFIRTLGLVGLGTFGLASTASAQQPVSRIADPDICSEWKQKLQGGIPGFSDFQSLARGIGVADLVQDGFKKPIALEPLLSGGAPGCLSDLIQANPDLRDAAEFLPLRLRLLNTNGDGQLDKDEVIAKISGAKTPVDRKRNAESAAYAVVLEALRHRPEDPKPVEPAERISVSSSESPTAAQLDKTLRNAQGKNRLFMIGGAVIAAAVMIVVLALKRIAGLPLWRYGLVKLFPSQHQRLLKGPRQKAFRTIAKIEAVETAAERRLKPKKKKEKTGGL